MKKIIIALLTTGISATSFAGDIHLQRGEVAKVIVEGCKTSEYPGVSNTGTLWQPTDSIVAKCLPKICNFGTPTWFGTVITLHPGDKEIGRTHNKAETRALLKTLVESGVCAETMGHGPDM